MKPSAPIHIVSLSERPTNYLKLVTLHAQTIVLFDERDASNVRRAWTEISAARDFSKNYGEVISAWRRPADSGPWRSVAEVGHNWEYGAAPIQDAQRPWVADAPVGLNGKVGLA